MTEEFNVGVVGGGYVGLVTGACLAHVGHRVTVVDKDAGRIEQLEQGRVPFFEPNLEELVARNRRQLSFTTELSEVVR
ncbi:MAG: FAD-dependent monooxygenase, partial [Actinomycetota bacterium]|nr:FAD-dependent monooxygenase [Actinomycetota bacterium]